MALVYPELLRKGKTHPLPDLYRMNPAERIFSVAAGVFLLFSGIRNFPSNPLKGISKTLAGAALIGRGATEYCPLFERLKKGTIENEAVSIKLEFVVKRPRREVYQFWRKFENLPLFMEHLESVEQKEANLWHWKATFADGVPPLTWDAEMVKDRENEFIGWQSVKGSVIDAMGKVEFNDLPDGSGTFLQIVFSYNPPAGGLGNNIAKLFNTVIGKLIRDDVYRFKEYIEADSVPDEQ